MAVPHVPPTPKGRRGSGGHNASHLSANPTGHHERSSLIDARNRFSSAPALPQMNIMVRPLPLRSIKQ
jgi:hypothetical protein